LSRKGVLPEIVDLFGMATGDTSDTDESESTHPEEPSEEDQGSEEESDTKISEARPEPVVDDDDIDSFFG